MRLAIAGATGNVGREILRVLEETASLQMISSPVLLASETSEGEEIPTLGDDVSVKNLDGFEFNELDVVVFATPADVSKKYAPLAMQKGVKVVDLSGAFRTEESAPVISSFVNAAAVKSDVDQVTVAGVATTQLATVLAPLMKNNVVKSVTATAMFPVSFAGKHAMDELFAQSAGLLGGAGSGEEMEGDLFQAQMAFNVIPQVGNFVGAQTDVETGILLELNRVLEKPVPVTTTAVYVPTFVGVSQSVTLEFEGAPSVDDVRKTLADSEGLVVIDNVEKGEFTTPYGTAETSQVFVSRIRADALNPNKVQLFVACDNLRTGAALQVIKVLERLL